MKPSFEDQEELERMRGEFETVEAKEIALPEKVAMQFGKSEIFAKIEEYRPFVDMTIAGPADKTTYAKVKAASTALMRLRTGTDARKKALKAEAIAYNKTVDEAYNEIVAAIASIEGPLDQEIKRIDDLAKAEAEAKQKAINERVAKRTSELLALRHDVTGIAHLLAGMPEDQYQVIFSGAKTKFDAEEAERIRKEAELARLQAEEAERQRLKAEQEAAERKAEAERLEAQRKAQAEAQAKLDAERAEIERERKAIEEAKAAQKAQEEAKARKEAEAKAEEERKAREAKIAAEAAEAARIEAERQAEEKRKQDEAKAKAEAARLAAIEAARPDADKLTRYAESMLAVPVPEMATKAGQDACKHAVAQVEALALAITKLAQSLTK